MLSAKAWKTDAIVRLGISVFVSVYAGLLVLAASHAVSAGRATWIFYVLLVTAFTCLGWTLVLLRKPWNLADALSRLIRLLVCFYLGIFVGAWAQKIAGPSEPSVSQMLIGVLSFQGASLVFVALFLSEQGITLSEGFGLDNNRLHAVMLGMILACLFLPLGWTLQTLSAKAMLHLPHFHLKPEEQQAVHTMQAATTAMHRWLLGLVTMFLVPPAEETLFRGILYPWIKQAGYPRLALWGSSIAFATFHFNLVTFVPLLVFALALTILYERTGNLLAPISAHVTFNALNFVKLCLLERS